VTTRQKRPGEIDGQHYYFATEEEFSNMVQQDAFLEYTRVFSEHSYGTPKKSVTEHLDKGKDVILEIDVQGGLQIKNAFPDAVLVFIAPPDMNELQKRLIQRGTESDTAIRLRTETAYMEMQCVSYYDYLVVNSDVETAMLDIKAIISSEKSKVSRNDDFLELLLGGFAYHDELSGRE
jgi:guanylate kinase